jgi:hypothetical protein
VFSQNGEDGLIGFLLSEVGADTRSFVEIGIGDGRQCNSANLCINFGWSGLMIDGSAENVASARRYYESVDNLYPDKLDIVHAFVDRDNVDAVVSSSAHARNPDVLSIDIDGNDFHVWHAVTGISPRIVVIEYNASFGPDRSVTVPHDPVFDRYKKHPSGWYHGASLKAMEHLGRSKGYRLVGCDSDGVNAFFVREDLAAPGLNTVGAAEAYYPEWKRTGQSSVQEQFETIGHLPLEPV